MACDKPTLERLKRLATGNGASATWARSQVIRHDPEWAAKNIVADRPAVEHKAPYIVTSTMRRNYEASEDVDAFAHTLTTALADKWEELTGLPFKELEERLKLILRDCEASDIPT